ncbi:MAG: T9SS type A sorting domain-containing protein [Saprospiraceae bacterium]|nr:T9SS type A sorting domain-containing protein [Saprospiraceae bacterium]
MKICNWIIFLNVVLIQSAHCQKFFINDWSNSGMRTSKFVEDEIINVYDRGVDSTGIIACDQIVQGIINEKVNAKRILFFPKGKYLFTKSILINRNNIVIRGEKKETQFLFNLQSKATDCIKITGNLSNESSTIVSEANIGLQSIIVKDATKFKKGDWIRLQCKDSAIMFSSWARGSLGQILQIDSIYDNVLILSGSLRYNYTQLLSPFVTKIDIRSQVGIECLSLKRIDSTTTQTTNIAFDYCANSWVNGVESNLTNFAHLAISYSAHIQVHNSYFHHSHSYGGGGQGYGVVLQFASSQCKVENNILEHLRHAILFQSGSNGNVVAFNYMIDPYWTQSFSPTNSAGDIVLHGNFPFANLIEGNINQNSIIDNSHGLNGPWNTFYKNRSELYGIIVTTSNCVDSLQIIENEITSSSLGYYVIQGKGNIELANVVKGNSIPASTLGIDKRSLFLTNEQFPYCYNEKYLFPYIGKPNSYNYSTIPAKENYNEEKYFNCNCEIINSTKNASSTKKTLQVYPNPIHADGHLFLNGLVNEIFIYDSQGYRIYTGTSQQINLSLEQPGIFWVKAILPDNTTQSFKLIKF